uniref:Protein Wnt n=1 Tax=Schmidtea mediterranea TaxID=79327 RepID=C3U5B3_SCHMD|nr:WntP-4 [Schmidtea mediterranea]
MISKIIIFIFMISPLFKISLGNSITNLHRIAILSQKNSSNSTPFICDRIRFENSIYSRLCSEKPEVINLIAMATSAALEECNKQLKYHRWDCGCSNRLFQQIVEKYSKEAAYLNAITTAGITYYVTKACSRGDLKFCQCSADQQDLSGMNKDQLTNCNENVDYGKSFTEIFLDGPVKLSIKSLIRMNIKTKMEKRKKSRSAFKIFLELYNNHVARNVIIKSMETKCKCQGASGACTSKYCWKTLPDFSKIGEALKNKYLNAKKLPRILKKRIRKNLSMGEDISLVINDPFIEEDQLMFLRPSFDYCFPNMKLGIKGVNGRECEDVASGPTSCNNLCCNYGFVKVKKLVVEQCNCKFKWCCKVECEKCEKMTTKFYCKIPQTSKKFHKYYLNG